MNLTFLENKYFLAIFAIFSGLYSAQIRPGLPKFIMDLFQNPIFRVLILSLIVVRSYKDIEFSIIIAMSFLLITNIVINQLFEDKFTNTDVNINENNIQQICNDTFLEKESIISCINTIDKYTTALDDKDINLSKLYCMNNIAEDKLSTTCKNVSIPPISELPNINCIEQYKLKPTYDLENIKGDCSKLR
jgi:hypothetical protein